MEAGECSDRFRVALRFVVGRLPTPALPETSRCFGELLFLRAGGGWCAFAPAVTPETVCSPAVTVTGRARLSSSRLNAEGSSQAEDGEAAEVTTDISWWPAGGRVNAVVCGRGRWTGSQNILDFGTAPHTSWLCGGGSGDCRIGCSGTRTVQHDVQVVGVYMRAEEFSFSKGNDLMLTTLQGISCLEIKCVRQQPRRLWRRTFWMTAAYCMWALSQELLRAGFKSRIRS